ncbi:MAG: primosomal protein N', partial [Arcobacteraceae bacterium]
MFFYEVTLLNTPLDNLTYQSEQEINIGTLVEVSLQQRKKLLKAVVVKKVEKPSFKCINIELITEYFYDNKMIETASFISKYYVCSLGEALSVYTPFYKIEIIEDDVDTVCDIQLSANQQKAYN